MKTLQNFIADCTWRSAKVYTGSTCP